MASIADQHVVVLGGTSGFGFATAKAAIAEGARVTIASRSAEKVRDALVRLGNGASGECVDVTDKPMLERFFAGLGPFDHLAVTVGDPLLNKQIMELTDDEARSAACWPKRRCCAPAPAPPGGATSRLCGHPPADRRAGRPVSSR